MTRPPLRIEDARYIGKLVGARGVIVLAFNDDGTFPSVSWGRTKRECTFYGKLMDRLIEHVRDVYDEIPSDETP